jgi:NitT/TauT family transport system substrate-binding protein
LHALPLEQSGVKKWGESSLANYDDYIDFLMKWGVVKQKVPATDLVTNELIDDINTFDPAAVVAQARAMPP